MKKIEGISLIVLIITIVVVIILAAAVILTISKNNPILSAKEAVFKEDVRNFQDELNMYVSNEYMQNIVNRDKKITTVNVPATKEEMLRYIPSYKEKYAKKLGIEDDKLVYFPDEVTKIEKKWLEDLEIEPYGKNIEEADVSIFKWDINDDTRIIGYNESKFNEYITKNNGILKIPEKCKKLGLNCFNGCDNIISAIIPNSVVSIESGTFSNCTKMKSIKLPENIGKTINKYTFYNCISLKSIYIPNGVEIIDENAFNECRSLFNVDFPDTLTSIRFQAFYNCSSLKNLNIPNKVIKIDWSSFRNCKELETVTLGKELNTIGMRAFEGCEKLQNIIIPQNVTNIGRDAFKDTAWYNSIEDGIVYINDTLYNYKGTMPSNTHIDIKDGTKFVSSYAFLFCTNLESVTIPDGVKSINKGTFANCEKLNSVSIPSSVTSIEDDAFSYCSSLSSITVPDSVTKIGWNAFRGCENLKEINLSNNLKRIEKEAFGYDTNLTNLILPRNLSYIDEYAFYDCVNLKSINYRGTKDEWNNISKNKNWNNGSSITNIICSDGEINL